MSIDWSKAPEGATHVTKVYAGCWYRNDEGAWYYHSPTFSWLPTAMSEDWQKELLIRPAEWRGPQDGLPPVGVEVSCYGGGGEWKRGTILAHVHGPNREQAIFQNDTDWSYGAKDNFRPIQTNRDAGYRKGEPTCSTK